MINKKTLSERDICTKYITPAIQAAGWDIDKQILEEVSFTDGRIYVRGRLTARGKRKRADYILYYNSNPLAIIEAKDNKHSVNAGIQRALDYAKTLDIIAIIGTGATPLTSNKNYYNGNIPWITSSATGNLFVTEAEKCVSEIAIKETNCKVYPIGTLIVAMYGQGKTRGQITELLIEAATNQACAAIQLITKDENHKNHIKYFFQKIYLDIRELAEGGAQPNLNLQKIKDTLIPLPPFKEQQRIVAKVRQLQLQLSQLESQVQQSREYAEQLLQAVLKEAFEEKGTVYEENEMVSMVAEE